MTNPSATSGMSNPSTRGPGPNRNSMEKASSSRAIHRNSDRATLPNGRGSERRGPSSERRSQGQGQGGEYGSKVSGGYRSDVLLSLDRPPSSSLGDVDSERAGGGGGVIHTYIHTYIHTHMTHTLSAYHFRVSLTRSIHAPSQHPHPPPPPLSSPLHSHHLPIPLLISSKPCCTQCSQQSTIHCQCS